MSTADFHRRAMTDALTDAAEQTSVDRKAVAIAEAQVHATAALVEEQHTANLIAFHADDTTAPDDYTVADGSAQMWWQALVGSIRERLGLA